MSYEDSCLDAGRPFPQGRSSGSSSAGFEKSAVRQGDRGVPEGAASEWDHGTSERLVFTDAGEGGASIGARAIEVTSKGCLVDVGGIQRGEIWWADLPEPRRSEPGYRRPVLVVQADSFNLSRIQTAIVAAITSNIELAAAPGNVLLPAREVGLPRDSVVNVSQLLTLDRGFLTEHAGTLPSRLQRLVDEGLRTVLQI